VPSGGGLRKGGLNGRCEEAGGVRFRNSPRRGEEQTRRVPSSFSHSGEKARDRPPRGKGRVSSSEGGPVGGPRTAAGGERLGSPSGVEGGPFKKASRVPGGRWWRGKKRKGGPRQDRRGRDSVFFSCFRGGVAGSEKNAGPRTSIIESRAGYGGGGGKKKRLSVFGRSEFLPAVGPLWGEPNFVRKIRGVGHRQKKKR